MLHFEPNKLYIRLMSKYNWQQNDWPNFTYNLEELEETLLLFIEKVGLVTGKWLALNDESKQESVINMMVSEAIKTSEIEGEFVSRVDVLSSIRKNLGLLSDTSYIKDKRAVGVAELMINVRNSYREPLSAQLLHSWHETLFNKRRVGIEIGAWRTHAEPMQIVSGASVKEVIHFEAPPSGIVPREMERYFDWYNAFAQSGTLGLKLAPVHCAIAHVYFESIHPYEDGNGRIGRAIAEKALSQALNRPVLLSLSQTINENRNAYYEALKKAQRSNEINEWIHYFVNVIIEAQVKAEKWIDFTLKKGNFFDVFREKVNERQLKVLNRMLEQGYDGFEGGMSARKYMAITKTSKATATRDMQELLQMGAFKRIGDAGGRSTKYEVDLG